MKAFKRIMLVDEDKGLLIPIKHGFEQFQDFIVDTYSNPLDALSSFQPELYDLVLLGVRMSPINGFELCKELQIKDTAKKTKICFITSCEPYRDLLEEEYPELNVECFIITPISIEGLIKKIKDVL
jgi:DNA-binding response OmpR family regulator